MTVEELRKLLNSGYSLRYPVEVNDKLVYLRGDKIEFESFLSHSFRYDEELDCVRVHHELQEVIFG